MPSKDDMIPGLDLDEAVRTHAGMCDRVFGQAEGRTKPRAGLDQISSDSRCVLGKWIHGRATLRYARLPEFAALRDAHADLHVCAANAVKIQREGDRDPARAVRDRSLRPALDTFRDALDRFCTAGVRLNLQARQDLALAAAKVTRSGAMIRAAGVVAVAIVAAVLTGVFAPGFGAALPFTPLRLPDVLVALALAGTGLYFFVLRPLFAAREHLGQVQGELRSADAAMETLSPTLVTDTNGMILRVNRAFTATTGYSAADLEGKTPRVLKSARQDATFYAAMWASLADSGAWRGKAWNKRKDGGEFLADLGITAVRGATGEILRYVAVLTDLTEGRAGLLAEAPAGQSGQPGPSAQARGEFLGHMGHELRTPMNAMVGYTDLALAEPLAEKPRKYLEQVRESGRLLLAKIDDLLDLSTIESGNLVLEQIPFDLKAVIESTCRNAIVLAATKGIRLESDIDGALPASVRGDPGRTAQIVQILLSNAIRYTERGTVGLSVKVHRLGPREVTVGLMVTDTGSGMDEAQVLRLFKPFADAPQSAMRREGGAGMGLAIAKSLVDQMGGTIAARSTPGEGSAFHVVLSFDLAGGPEPAPDKPRRAPLAGWDEIPAGRYAGKRVLIAEDDEDNQGLIRVIMEQYGFSVDMAVDGREAVRKFSEAAGAYDLVLMDIRMPEMDGLEATRIIRATHTMAVLPIVALSANAYDEDRQKSLNAGMNAHVTKPLRADQLDVVLERVLG